MMPFLPFSAGRVQKSVTFLEPMLTVEKEPGSTAGAVIKFSVCSNNYSFGKKLNTLNIPASVVLNIKILLCVVVKEL